MTARAALVVALALAGAAHAATAAETLTGPAQAIDADSLMVQGHEIRIEVVDAPAWDQVSSGAFSVLAVALGVWLGAWFALRGYFRQKEYELVKERYLEGAIDIVASEVDHSLGVEKHNWARCLEILKAFRDEKDVFDKKELSKGFLETHAMDFNRIALHRIERLVGYGGAQMIWIVYQTALAEASVNNAFYTKEIPSTIRTKLTTSLIKTEPKEIVEALYEDVESRDEKSHRFADLVSALYHLGALLETEKMTFKQVGEFKNRREVMSILTKFERDFAKDLTVEDDKPSDAKPNGQQG